MELERGKSAHSVAGVPVFLRAVGTTVILSGSHSHPFGLSLY
jgi:hypothetical protein